MWKPSLRSSRVEPSGASGTVLLAPVALAALLAGCAAPDGAPGAEDPATAPGRAALERGLAERGEEGGEPFNQPQERAAFFLEQRLPRGERDYPWEHVLRERDAIRARERELARRPEAAPAVGDLRAWDWIGPGNVGGRTRAIVVDPSNPSTMYAAGVAGGVWKSLDAGGSWSPADDMLDNLAVSALAIDPVDPNVLYAGTGEGYYLSNVFVRGMGVFKSVDAGATWSQLAGTVSGVPDGAFDYVNKVRISPNDRDRIYAATRTGVWCSLDGGATWSVVLGNPAYVPGPYESNGSLVGCTDLVVRGDRDPDVLFAAFGSVQADGLFRSLDGGDTWVTYSVPANQGRMTLALAPGDNDVLYVLMADNGSGGALGQLVNLYRSGDGGNTFTGQVDLGSLAGPWLLSNLTLATGCLDYPVYSQGWYDNIVAVDPVDADVVWVGGIDLFRSDDAGVNFGIASYWFLEQVAPGAPQYVHADQHEIVFHPHYDGAGNQTMYVGNDGGIFRTDNARAATSLEDCPLPGTLPLPQIAWQSLNSNYGVTQFYHGDAGRNVDLFVGGAQDNGTNRARSASSINAWDTIFGGDGGYVAIDPTDPDTMYVEFQDFPSIQKSVDGGDTFVEATNGITDTEALFITPFAMNPADPQTLWTGGRRPWRTQDGAASWQVAGPDLPGPDRISAIAVAPSRSDVVYLGFTNGFVARTTNGTSPAPTWQVFTQGLVGAFVSSVAVDPYDPDTAYATYSTFGVPHVLRTTNGGQSWLALDGSGQGGLPDLPAHWIAVRPCDPQQLYVGTELGLFASDDGGATWVPANPGLPLTVVESLDFRDPDRLVAFTHGRGAYVALLDPCTPASTGPPDVGRRP